MILTAHQPVYLPWLGLFHKLALSDTFVFLDTVQYLKKDWNNRNKIKTTDGWIWLTVPVLTAGMFNQTLQEVRVDSALDWKRKHWQSIRLNYSKAPYFHRYADFFADIYSRDWVFLDDLNETILRFLLSELKIKVTFIKASEGLKLEHKKSDLVLEMCLKLQADAYIFGARGNDYAEVDKFNHHGIQVIFQDYQHPEYRQQFGTFEPYMSTVDLLFNHGDSSLDVIMSGNMSHASVAQRQSV